MSFEPSSPSKLGGTVAVRQWLGGVSWSDEVVRRNYRVCTPNRFFKNLLNFVKLSFSFSFSFIISIIFQYFGVRFTAYLLKLEGRKDSDSGRKDSDSGLKG